MKEAKDMPPLECPLCKAPTLEYRQIKGRTHAWVCEECPAVLMEFYDAQNSLDVHNSVNGVKDDEQTT